MSKFKAGDKVRVLNGGGCFYSNGKRLQPGDIIELTKVEEEIDEIDVVWRFSFVNAASLDYYLKDEWFELVNEINRPKHLPFEEGIV